MTSRVSFLCLLLLLACKSADRACTRRSGATHESAHVRLVVLTDPQGVLEPAPCLERPLGGLARWATALAELRREQPATPLLVVAAGDLAFGEDQGHDWLTGFQQRSWQAELWVDTFSALGSTAVGPGVADLRQPVPVLATLWERSRFPWLADNIRGPRGGLSSARIVSVGAVRVGLLGLLGPSPWQALSGGRYESPDLPAAARATGDELRAQGAHLVVALLAGDTSLAREVAQAGVDVVVLGGPGEREVDAPVITEGGLVVSAGARAEHFVTLDLWLAGAGKWRAAGEQPVGADAGLGTAHAGRWFAWTSKELSWSTPISRALADALAAHHRRVYEHNRVKLAKRNLPKDGMFVRRPPLPVVPQAYYVGSDSCRDCHAEAYAWWKASPHARAYASLESLQREFDLHCVRCHVTGYLPGWSAITHVSPLRDVGCESCHGPASLHLKAPRRAGRVARAPLASACVQCHDGERFTGSISLDLLPRIRAEHPRPTH